MILVLLPIFLGGLDVPCLGAFISTAQQEDDGVAFLSEIDPVSWAEEQAQFENAFTDRLAIAV